MPPDLYRVTTLQSNSLTVRGTRHVKCYSYHARTSVTVSGGVEMQQYMIRNHILNI